MQAVHLRAADLAILTRSVQCLSGLRLLRALLVHLADYTSTALPRQRRF